MKDWFSAAELLGERRIRDYHRNKFISLRADLFKTHKELLSLDLSFRIKSSTGNAVGVSITSSHKLVREALQKYLNVHGSAVDESLWDHLDGKSSTTSKSIDSSVAKINVCEHDIHFFELDSNTLAKPASDIRLWNDVLWGDSEINKKTKLAKYSGRVNYAKEIETINTNKELIVVTVFYTSKKNPTAKEKKVIHTTIRNYCMNIALDIVAQIGEYNYLHLLKQSRAAAISQVLARTLSHNLGSHSLNRFSRPRELKKVIEDLYFECAKYPPKEWLPGRILGAPLQSMGPIISAQRDEWISYYNNYLRERMDFLADITTAVPAFEAKTHLVGDILNGYANNVLLATTIAGDYEFDYRWIPQLNGAEDVLVSIPADILGRHAFYIILENIVRNSAKHGQHGSHTVDYTVKVEPIGTHPGYLKVTILDNHPGRTVDEARRRAVEANGNINATVLGDDGHVRSNAWGMLEMKACAAYLRRVALENLDDAKYHARVPLPGTNELPQLSEADALPLLEAVSERNRLGYTFYLQRPKDVMVVGSDLESVFGVTQESVLEKHGIGFMSVDGLKENKVIPHALLAVDARDTAALDAFIVRAKADMNSLPHEILLIQGTDNDVQHAKGKLAQSLNGLECATVLLDSIRYISEDEWSNIICSSPTDIYTALRQRWQVEWMKGNKYRVGNPTTPFEDYRESINPETKDGKILVNANYVPHGDFYVQVQNDINDLSDSNQSLNDIGSLCNMPDLSGLLATCRAKSFLPIVQCYPSALCKVMEPEDGGSGMGRKEWAQHHFTSWMQGVAVLDERIQRCAETDRFTPRQDGTAVPVVVKHLLAMGQVFVPPADTLGLERDMTEEKWGRLMNWIQGLGKGLRYLCVHLTILEKFAKSVEESNRADASLESLLSKIRRENPHVRIIIVSGRGQPGNLPKGELFMSYSALSQYTTQTYQRAPVLLNLLCHSARRLT